MKFNAEVDLRRRSRRKWFVLLTGLLVAGGWWYRADQMGNTRMPSPTTTARAEPRQPASSGAPSMLIDASVARPFSAPSVAFDGFLDVRPGNPDPLVRSDFLRPIQSGMEPVPPVSATDLWLGSRAGSGFTPISVSRSGTIPVAIQTKVLEPAPPKFPKSFEPAPAVMPAPR